MTYNELKLLIRSDLHRYYGKTDTRTLLYCLRNFPGFEYTFWMRVCAFLDRGTVARQTMLRVSRATLTHYEFKYGISIPYRTNVGSGFYIGHFGGIVVNETAVIGRNCNIMQGVTIGQVNRGSRQGVPVIGDNVFLGPGAKILGKITIGNHAVIGANSVVTKDVPEMAVVVGIPGKVISYEGSAGYVNRVDYESP